jgi:hypothetical protein
LVRESASGHTPELAPSDTRLGVIREPTSPAVSEAVIAAADVSAMWRRAAH